MFRVGLNARNDSSAPRFRRPRPGSEFSKHLQRLSEYPAFSGDLADLVPVLPVPVPLRLVNTPLFTDYAGKAWVIRLPEGASLPYNASKVFDFPVGNGYRQDVLLRP